MQYIALLESRLLRHPSVPWVLPFAVFAALLGLQNLVPIHPAIRFAILIAVIAGVSRPALRGRPSQLLLSVLLGLAVFVLWIGPDLISPTWHNNILFHNGITGAPVGATTDVSKTDSVFLVFRIAISVIAVPILEELFWRGWLMRWLIDSHDFERVRLGTYAAQAFWIVAVFFALEHGSFWDVGLLTGVIYNWWMVRTRNLWDCIVAHAVTNAALAAYVVLAGQWQYWL